jgi:hypothetical protein
LSIRLFTLSAFGIGTCAAQLTETISLLSCS